MDIIEIEGAPIGKRGKMSGAKQTWRDDATSVSYTHLRAHETVLDLVCRLLLEKKKHTKQHIRRSLLHEPTIQPTR